jgi:hypothetical protein
MRFADYVRDQGYRRYRGAVDASVYRAFRCLNPDKAVWHVKDGSYQCTGCREQCETDNPAGFQATLLKGD